MIFGCITAGKLFSLSDEMFDCLQAEDTPFIGVVSYGNGYYGIALTEMRKRAEARGFKVTALGAFVARHCPVDAIDIEARTFDLDKCIGCWGCVNRCPKRAIASTSAEMSEIMKGFSEAAQARLEPEIFL